MPRWSLVLLAGLLATLLLCLAVSSIAVPWYAHEGMTKKVGGCAPLYLYEPSPYDRIVVEVHYEPSAEPSDAALSHLQSVLGNYTGKQVVVTRYGDIGPKEVPPSLDGGQVTGFGNRMMAEHAVAYTGLIGGDAMMYIWYVNASAPEPRLDKSNRVGGVSYRGDSFVIFKNNLRDEGEEKTVLVHEAGHLLGLDHDDNQSCAMVGSLVRLHKRGYTPPPPEDYCENHTLQLEYERHHLPVDDLLGLVSIPGLR